MVPVAALFKMISVPQLPPGCLASPWFLRQFLARPRWANFLESRDHASQLDHQRHRGDRISHCNLRTEPVDFAKLGPFGQLCTGAMELKTESGCGIDIASGLAGRQQCPAFFVRGRPAKRSFRPSGEPTFPNAAEGSTLSPSEIELLARWIDEGPSYRPLLARQREPRVKRSLVVSATFKSQSPPVKILAGCETCSTRCRPGGTNLPRLRPSDVDSPAESDCSGRHPR